MSTQPDLEKLTVEQFTERFRQEMIPLSSKFSYFPAMPMAEEDIKEYLDGPIAALPPRIPAGLPKIAIFLVPFLEKVNGKQGFSDLVSFEKPPESRQAWVTQHDSGEQAVLVFAIRDQEVADYHDRFFRAVATLIADRWDGEPRSRYLSALREELKGEVHGEVDERSWHMKQALLRRQTNVRRETKLFVDYARQSFIDTLTLYLHGICCDIDVETGPRQLPSRYIRKRLDLLHGLYPPPEGYAVFPEELNGE